MTPDYDCLIQYLEVRRDMQGWTDDEWNAATCVIDWLKSHLEYLALVTEANYHDRPNGSKVTDGRDAG